jgi:molybdenum cofactor cytidylyltransferase
VRIVGILLAAGQGSRFGGDKLLAQLADGTRVGVQSARNLKAALAEVIAVTRPEDRLLAQALTDVGIDVATCPSAHEGMGSSLAHAVRARADADGWIVALGDMPMIRPETIRRIAAALEGGAGIVAPSYQGKRGHPVGFAARFGAQLANLSGDAGARNMLRAEGSRIVVIDVDDPGVMADIDTRAELDRMAGG